MTFGSRAFLVSFLNEFIRTSEKTNWKEIWNEPKTWTEKMLGSSQSRKNGDYGLLGNVGQIHGYLIQSEWMRIDQVWYNNLEKNEELDFTPWKTDVVIEHENDIGKLIRTIYKLSEASAPLKILISYPGLDDGDKYIDISKNIIKKLPNSYPGGVYLFVFGFLGEEKDVVWNFHEVDWKGNDYLLNKLIAN